MHFNNLIMCFAKWRQLWLINTIIKATMSAFLTCVCVKWSSAFFLLLLLLSLHLHYLCTLSENWKAECRVEPCKMYATRISLAQHLTYDNVVRLFFSSFAICSQDKNVPMEWGWDRSRPLCKMRRKKNTHTHTECSSCSFLMRTNVHIFLICRTVTRLNER